MISRLTSNIKDKFKQLLILNPVEHAYPLWHLEYESKMCRWLLWIEDSIPQCYMLVYEGFREPDVHLRSLTDDTNIVDKLKKLLAKISHHRFVLHTRREHFNLVRSTLTDLDVKRVYGIKVMECIEPRAADYNEVIELKPSNWPLLVDVMLEVMEARGIKCTNPPLEAYNNVASYRTFAIVKGGKAVAMASIVALTPHVAIIGNVYTLKNFRGMGYGKAVTSKALSEALKLSSRVIVWVREDNYSAIRLYESLGFKQVIDDVWINVGLMFNP
ncbi:MAG: GNAT family N-acetyltransferase [Candidatus Nezhaarchaeota archaeon]|nr:GNAT family N-acetyltransferase [Candidatus Nezhaarchaeota archaeon]MCX8141447.1 GNAT family N-acetyltransferase [Candidatus Nezhaarchaeota archaeon]MDW8049713.1 GNAT family N-acetyltransferase [Nitrososphaerota archaeon]